MLTEGEIYPPPHRCYCSSKRREYFTGEVKDYPSGMTLCNITALLQRLMQSPISNHFHRFWNVCYQNTSATSLQGKCRRVSCVCPPINVKLIEDTARSSPYPISAPHTFFQKQPPSLGFAVTYPIRNQGKYAFDFCTHNACWDSDICHCCCNIRYRFLVTSSKKITKHISGTNSLPFLVFLRL